MRHWTDDI